MFVPTDELTVNQPFAVLKAPNVWGALHGRTRTNFQTSYYSGGKKFHPKYCIKNGSSGLLNINLM